jgi:hypothetical protein
VSITTSNVRVVETERIEQMPEAWRQGAAVDQHPAAAILDQRRVALPHVEHADDEFVTRRNASRVGRWSPRNSVRRSAGAEPQQSEPAYRRSTSRRSHRRQGVARIIESRFALNSVPAFHCGSASACATE